MKISFETKIFLGYMANITVMVVLGLIFWRQITYPVNVLWNWLILALIVTSVVMLSVVYFILKAQLKAKKKAELGLIKNEHLLHSIINNTDNAISVKKINGEYILANTRYQLLFESKEKNLIGKTNHEFLAKEIADGYRSTDLDAIKAGKGIQVEEIFDEPDGPHTYLSVKFPLFDATDRVYAIGNISTDITARKQLEETLKTADTFFNLSFDSLIVATENTFIKINPSFSKILGYSEEELLSKPFVNFIFPGDIAMTQKKIGKLKKGSQLVNYKNRWICKDGTIKWLSWNATIDMATEKFYAIARDITEQLNLKEKEEKALNELYENQQKLTMIIENISDGVIVANNNKEVIMANDVANELFGLADDFKLSIDFLGHFEILFPDGETIFPVQNLPSELALRGEATDNIDVILRDVSTNEYKRVLLSGRPIIDNENNVAAVVVTIKDISRYKKLEEELKKKDFEARPSIGFKTFDKKKKK